MAWDTKEGRRGGAWPGACVHGPAHRRTRGWTRRTDGPHPCATVRRGPGPGQAQLSFSRAVGPGVPPPHTYPERYTATVRHESQVMGGRGKKKNCTT